MDDNIIDNEIEEAKKTAQHFGVKYVSLRGLNIPFEVLSIIPEEIARKNQIVVYKKEDKHIDIAVADPKKLQQKAPQILTDLKKKDGYSFSISVTTPSDFNYALLGYKQKSDNTKISKKMVANDDSSKNMINLRGNEIAYDTLIKFPKNIAEKYRIIVFEEDKDGKKVKVAVEDPDNLQTQEILDFISSRNDIEIKQYKAKPEDISWALNLYDKKPEVEVKAEIKPESLQEKKVTENVDIKPMDEQPNKKEVEDHKNETKENEVKLEIEKPERKQITKNDIDPAILHQESGSDDIKNIDAVKDIDNKIPKMVAQKIANEKNEINNKDIEKPENNEIVKQVSRDYNEKSEEVSDIDVQPVEVDEVGSMSAKESMTLTATSDEDQNLDQLLPNGVQDIKGLAQIVKSGSIPRIVASILYLATKLEASDVHIEADSNNLYLRYRMDGVLKEVLKMPVSLQSPIVSRIKILAKMKIDEQRIPQDGRFDVIVLNKRIDLRVSTLPTIHGEKVVMRLLDKTTGVIGLEKLGLIGDNLKRLKISIDKPYGIIFITGPTGSGKTTTLYAMLNKLNTPDVNIITLEDPVEYELPGINQCQIKPKIGFGFADGLRSILRQDPNIIMVGEVRDSETANMATHAALTGHLVLSTLHTNDSCGALPRLIDMGVEPYLITSSINAIVAQRLVRKLCDKCKVESQVPERLKKDVQNELAQCHDQEIKKLASGEMKFYKPKGCSECKDGYKGRIGLYEVLTMTDRIEQLAVNRASTSIIKRAALNQGLVTIRQDGFAKAVMGVTSIDEIIRATSK